MGTGGWAASLTQFVDVAKAFGEMRAVANLSFDLSQQNPDGSVTTRHQLTPAESKALDYAKQNNVLVVASAGNEGGEMSALGKASKRSDNLIVVGTAQGNDRAAYSSFGPGLDFLVSAESQQQAGTSMAAAETTRAIAQLWSAHPHLSSSQVVQVLEVTAQDLKTPGWDVQTGLGRLNPVAAGLAADTLPAQSALAKWGVLKTSPGSNREMWTGGEGAIASERPNRLTGDLSRPPSSGISAARARNEHQAHRPSAPSSGMSAARTRNEHQAHRPQSSTSQTLKYTPGTAVMSSDRVRQWQNAMKAQGFNIDVDGKFGPQSAAVAREFQRRNGLEVDGKVGPQTWQASFPYRGMSPDTAERYAQRDRAANQLITAASGQETIKYVPGTSTMSSDRVRQWQTAMKNKGYNIDVDGKFGPQSAAVAREFQRRNGLEVDGKVGPQTWAASFVPPVRSTPSLSSTIPLAPNTRNSSTGSNNRRNEDLLIGRKPSEDPSPYFFISEDSLGEIGMAAIGARNPDFNFDMLYYSSTPSVLGHIRENGNHRFGLRGNVGVLRFDDVNVLKNLQESGSVSETSVGDLDLGFLPITGEANLGNDGFSVGLAGSILDGAYTWGSSNPNSDRDGTERIGLGYGMGSGVRGHWDDADNDGTREGGLGVDIGPISFDVTNERSGFNLIGHSLLSGIRYLRN
ncbi:MAG: S8 family serine peptidase [Phormidesmis sp. RL_2_1]|nr:S8 family serine peptidase [Phormidesmis sp. RL_2_1]